MENLFKRLLDKLEHHEPVVLCSIIASSGSTPRGKGAKMLVYQDGTTYGTIGGGAVEYESTLLAKESFKERRAFQHSYNLTSNETADIGMVCGGAVVVYFQYIKPEDEKVVAMIRYITMLFKENLDSWLITKVNNEQQAEMGLYERHKGLVFGDVNKQLLKPLLKSKGMLYKDVDTYYVEPLTESGMVYVFGGGHVSQELVPLLTNVGFKVNVYEDREQFASEALFPSAYSRIVGDYLSIDKQIKLTSSDYVVIMTRGHQSDYDVLAQVMHHECSYVGVIGSQSKKAHTFEKLMAIGIPESKLERIHTPIGLPIKGETPAEIAVSITGEMILHRSTQQGIVK
ncbi:MAG: XdhC family protein [Clostridia bacterium]|nr:XdhC family protein [Clostridia bacterium]